MSLWIPGFERIDLGRDSPKGGYYDEYHHPKLGWHTWEGFSWAGAEQAFRPYPPHCAVNFQDKRRRQYVPLEQHAYAFAGSDNDDSYVIQVEVAGFANAMHLISDAEKRWLAEFVVRPITTLIPIPSVVVPGGFHGEWEGTLASKTSRFRLTVAQMDAFSGHLGHQHMPSPDQHWDPGKLPIEDILKYAHPTTTVEEDDMKDFFFTTSETKRRFMGNGYFYREVSDEDVKDYQALAGGKIPTIVIDPKQMERMNGVGRADRDA